MNAATITVFKTAAVEKAAKSWERAKRKLAAFEATYDGTDEAFDTLYRLECSEARASVRLTNAWRKAHLDQARARAAAAAEAEAASH